MPSQGPSLPGTAAGWATPNNAKSSTDAGAAATFAMPGAGATTTQLVLTNFGFAVPVGAVITAIEVIGGRVPLPADLGSCEINIALTKDGIAFSAPTVVGYSSAPGNMAFAVPASRFGLALSPAEVNAPTFGIGMTVTNDPGTPETPGGTYGLDFALVTVFYTAPSSALAVNYQSVTIPPYSFRF